jgi:AhpD family alkylhydroperoxidase
MSRETVYAEMKEMLGLVPQFFEAVPDHTIDLEWELFKQVQAVETVLPNKVKELIGIGISAVTKCKYCAYFHTEMAKLAGATDDEIREALSYSKSSAGWSAFINGSQADYQQFKKDVDSACSHIRKHMEAAG